MKICDDTNVSRKYFKNKIKLFQLSPCYDLFHMFHDVASWFTR